MSDRYDGFQQTYQKPRWDSVLNAGLDRIGDDIDTLESAQTSLNSLVVNWATTENYLIYCTATPTYVDGDTFTVPGDLTSSFPTGRVIQVDNGPTDGMLATTVTSSSHVGGTTTVELDDSVLTSNLVRVFFVASRDGLTTAPETDQVFAADYGSPGETALTNALAAIGVDSRALVLSPGSWSLANDLTIPSNVKVVMMMGATLEPADTKTLTINGPFYCGPHQCFDDQNSDYDGVVFGAGSVKEALLEWWGGAGDNSTDNDAALTSALNSGAPVIRLLSGTYLYGDTMSLVANTAIVGNGVQQTELVYSGSSYAISASNVSYWKLKDFKLTGSASAFDGVYIRKAQQGFTIDGLYITGFTNASYGRGIYLFGGVGQGNYFGNFFNVTSRDNYVGMRVSSDGSVYYCNAHRFYCCQFLSNDSDGIQIDYADGIAFHGCETEDNGGYGINIDHANSFTYFGGWIENNTAGEINYTADSRGAVIFSKVATNPIYYEGAEVTDYSASLSHKMLFILDSNNASTFVYPWLGYTYDLGGSTYGSRTIERTGATREGLKLQVAADTVARLNIRADGKHNWSDGSAAADVSLERQAADILKVTSALQLPEMTAPAAPGANQVIIYAVDNGSGKTKLMALFPSGAAQQLAIEP